MQKKLHGLLFLGILLLFVFGFQSAASFNKRNEQQQITETIQKLTLKCYSIEGRYPTSIAYLKEHYGLLIDEEEYRVNYHYEGANIAPHIDVYKKGRIYENAS